jgi:hypothetical protein
MNENLEKDKYNELLKKHDTDKDFFNLNEDEQKFCFKLFKVKDKKDIDIVIKKFDNIKKSINIIKENYKNKEVEKKLVNKIDFKKDR